MQTHNDTYINANMSSGRGSVDTTYDALVNLFGKPCLIDSFDGKVRAEWIIKFDDGTIATIYDWKEDQPLEQVTDWHVGGFSPKALTLVAAEITEAQNLTI